MTIQEINHVKTCKELMQEAARRANLKVELHEYKEGKNDFIQISLKDHKNYCIYTSYGNASQILGFIDGLLYK